VPGAPGLAFEDRELHDAVALAVLAAVALAVLSVIPLGESASAVLPQATLTAPKTHQKRPRGASEFKLNLF
jgi:hypothetical protein